MIVDPTRSAQLLQDDLADLFESWDVDHGTPQGGWDLGEFQCGWCYTTITATSEREYVDRVVGHKETCTGNPEAGVR